MVIMDILVLFPLRLQVCQSVLFHEADRATTNSILCCSYADADRVQCDKIAQMLEEEERQRKKQLHQAVLDFREREQQPSMRREWDIHDPEATRKGHPARLSDDDPRCGPSSMQRFAGEDLNANARQKLLKEQNKRILEEQRSEREKDLADRKYAGMFRMGCVKCPRDPLLGDTGVRSWCCVGGGHAAAVVDKGMWRITSSWSQHWPCPRHSSASGGVNHSAQPVSLQRTWPQFWVKM